MAVMGDLMVGRGPRRCPRIVSMKIKNMLGWDGVDEVICTPAVLEPSCMLKERLALHSRSEQPGDQMLPIFLAARTEQQRESLLSILMQTWPQKLST